MSPKTSPEKTTKSTGNKPVKDDIINIMDDAPLFAGLEDYIQIKTVKKKEVPPKAGKTKEKKNIVTKKAKPKTSDKPVPKRAPKPQKSQPLDPNAILLSVAEMCKLLKISRATLVRMDKAGKLPGRMKLGGSVRFHRQTVETWLQSLINTGTIT